MRLARVTCLTVFLPAIGFAQPMGDPEAGEDLYSACASCHEIGEGARNRAGPHLNGIVGRAAGAVEGFRYSSAIGASGLVWDADMLSRYIEDPQGTMPGTRMAYRGMADEQHRHDLIAYLATFEAEEIAAPFELSPEAAAVLAVAPDVAYGEYLSAECTACHSAGDAGIPRIEGLDPELFVTAMVEYRSGARTHQVMEMVSGRLGDEEIVSLAMYFNKAE